MYKDESKQKEANKERQRRYREKQKGVTEGVTKGVTEGVTSAGVTQKGVTEQCPKTVILSDGQIWHPDPKYWKYQKPKKEVSDYPAVVNAIVNHREKMEAITKELKARHLSDCVRYGIEGPTFDAIGDILDCVKP